MLDLEATSRCGHVISASDPKSPLVTPSTPISLQVMGMLQGKTMGDTFVVMDVFALPVEGTETRVNAQAEAYEVWKGGARR